MLGLPKVTELNRQLPKSTVYAKFQMIATAREKIDRDISRIYIVNEVSAVKVNLREGKEVKTFFVMDILLKRKEFDGKSIVTLSKLIPQKMVMVLKYGDEGKLATYRNKLLQTEWTPKDKLTLELRGPDLDSVWENIIAQIGCLTVESGVTLDEQIRLDDRRKRLQKEIDRLEKLACSEKQPKKKFELFNRLNRLKMEIDNVENKE